MIVKVQEDTPRGFVVWACIEDVEQPASVPESFVIGIGRTRDAAILDAMETLIGAMGKLFQLGRRK